MNKGTGSPFAFLRPAEEDSQGLVVDKHTQDNLSKGIGSWVRDGMD